MVSLTSYRIQLSLPLLAIKLNSIFRKNDSTFFLKCIDLVYICHVWWSWLSWFCTYCDWKNEDFNYISSLTGRNTSQQMIGRLVLSYSIQTFIGVAPAHSIVHVMNEWIDSWIYKVNLPLMKVLTLQIHSYMHACNIHTCIFIIIHIIYI